MEKSKSNTVVQGAIVLTIAGLLSKVLSATYRIPLQNLTGDLGFYLYQQIYPLIGIVMILALYGFPVAVSKLTAEMNQQNQVMTYRNFYIPVFFVLLILNSLLFVILFFIAPFIASWTGDVRLKSAFQLASFLFLLVPFSAIFRGVSQGNEQMTPTAFSQIVEQLIRVSIIIFAAYFVYVGKLNIDKIGEAGVIATMLGMVVSIMMLAIFYAPKKALIHSEKSVIPWRHYIYTCIFFGFIAALNQMVLLIIQFVDTFTLVPNLISFGFTPVEAMKEKGIFDRGQPLIQFGVVFGSSFALAIIPSVVKNNIRKRKEQVTYIRDAILFGFYLAAGATVGLICILPETNMLLFKNDAGTTSLQILVLSILLSSVAITASAILQSLGYIKQIAFWICMMFVIKWILNELLVPSFGINGSALATVSSLFVLAISMVIVLQRKLPSLYLFRHFQWFGFVVASSMMGMYIFIVKFLVPISSNYSRVNLLLYVLFIVVTGAIVYIILLLRYEVLSKKQWSALPFSSLILRLEKIVAKKK